MNERIKELIAQATIPVIETNDYNGMAYETYQFSQELFAELIIQKCITQISLIGVSNFKNEDIMWTVENAIASIETHFGVEE